MSTLLYIYIYIYIYIYMCVCVYIYTHTHTHTHTESTTKLFIHSWFVCMFLMAYVGYLMPNSFLYK